MSELELTFATRVPRAEVANPCDIAACTICFTDAPESSTSESADLPAEVVTLLAPLGWESIEPGPEQDPSVIAERAFGPLTEREADLTAELVQAQSDACYLQERLTAEQARATEALSSLIDMRALAETRGTALRDARAAFSALARAAREIGIREHVENDRWCRDGLNEALETMRDAVRAAVPGFAFGDDLTDYEPTWRVAATVTVIARVVAGSSYDAEEALCDALREARIGDADECHVNDCTFIAVPVGHQHAQKRYYGPAVGPAPPRRRPSTGVIGHVGTKRTSGLGRR